MTLSRRGVAGAILRLQRVDPSHTREPTEIHIGGTQFGAVFDRQSGEMSIARQISRRAKRSQYPVICHEDGTTSWPATMDHLFGSLGMIGGRRAGVN